MIDGEHTGTPLDLRAFERELEALDISAGPDRARSLLERVGAAPALSEPSTLRWRAVRFAQLGNQEVLCWRGEPGGGAATVLRASFAGPSATSVTVAAEECVTTWFRDVDGDTLVTLPSGEASGSGHDRRHEHLKQRALEAFQALRAELATQRLPGGEDQDVARRLAPAVDDLPTQVWKRVSREVVTSAERDEEAARKKQALPPERALDAEAYFNRGVVSFERGDLDQALADYGHALALDADFAEAWFNRSIILCSRGDVDGALADIERALALTPDSAAAHYRRGFYRTERGEHAASIGDFTEALRLDPELVEAVHDRGIAWQALDDHVRALADFNQAIELDPTLALGYYNRALSLRAQGSRRAAAKDLRKCIELSDDPGDREDARRELRDLEAEE